MMDEEKDKDHMQYSKEIHGLNANALIGYKKPFYYCKDYPDVENINKEEIEKHIAYSKVHRS